MARVTKLVFNPEADGAKPKNMPYKGKKKPKAKKMPYKGKKRPKAENMPKKRRYVRKATEEEMNEMYRQGMTEFPSYTTRKFK